MGSGGAREAILRVAPRLDSRDLRLLYAYHCAGPTTPYMVARRLGCSTATVYRRTRRLIEKRLVLPGVDGAPATGTLLVSVKGCAVLYAHRLLDERGLVSCVSRVWRGVRGPPEALVGLLHAVALEAERRGLGLRCLSVCRPEEAALPVLRIVHRALELHVSEALSMADALAEAAREAGMEPGELRAAARLAFMLAARLLPAAVVRTRSHTAVIIVKEGSVYPFAVECSHPHGGLEEESLGYDCPLLRREVREALGSLLV